MATYPYSFTDPSSGDDLATADHAGQHSYLNDVIEDVETVTGVDGSVDTNSADYIINHIVTDLISNNSIDLVELAAAVRELTVPAGTIKGYIGSTAPSGWVLMQGQTITNGSTLYPSLYSACPDLFSGSDLVVPDADPGYAVYTSGDFDSYSRSGSLNASHNELAEGVPAHNHGASTNHAHNESYYHAHGGNHYHSHNTISVNATAIYTAYAYYPFVRAANYYNHGYVDSYLTNTTNNFNGTVAYGNTNYTVYSRNKNLGNMNAGSYVFAYGVSSANYDVVPPSVVMNYIMKVH